MSENTNKPFAPSTRVVEGIHNGFVEVLNGAAVALMSEAMEAARLEIKKEIVSRDRALAGVLAAIERKQQQSNSLQAQSIMSDLGEEIRTVMELWQPRSGRIYDVCDRCNFSNHICMGCGEELSHLGEKVHNAGPGPKCHE